MADTPTVLVVTGRTEVGACGVADYAASLVRAVAATGVDIRQVGLDRVADLRPALRRVDAQTIVHMQYPLLAWRTSPIPLLLLLWLRLRGHRHIVLTIHEFSRAHWARRIACVLLARLSTLVISTSDYEATALRRRLPTSTQIEVVPIASNIAPTRPVAADTPRAGIVYFGLLAPEKGLEEFFDIVEPWLAEAVPVTVIGSVVPPHARWLESISHRHARARFLQSLASADVSAVLQAASVAVLPYPDGISERRGSALAALAHGVQVVSTRGRATTPELAAVCHLADNPTEARAHIARLLADAGARIDPSVIARYVASRSWDGIAQRHGSLYREQLAGKGAARWK